MSLRLWYHDQHSKSDILHAYRQSPHLLQWNGLPFPTQPGQVGGHEGVGKIVKLGADTESSGLKVGDRVGVKWISSACGNCRE